ncbi:Polyadenylate-binding protein RBP45B [Forsythia ovata]|uniref:Polyadenylate-binding protein RBP45B n=1 Tax=Forsythia ovata TaxID=205694 RepID=A0ABD1S641_9LAMI
MMQQPGGAVPPPMAMDQQQQQYPPQQWMMMPPQAPQHWPQQPPFQQQQQYSAAPANVSAPAVASGGSDEVRSLWIGDLQYWMDENYLTSCFYHTGELLSAKVIRNKQTGQSEHYGFLEFRTHAAAENILQSYNGAIMPNSEQTFRLNWASPGAGQRRSDDTPDYTIFVGDLAADVTDYLLQETFTSVYSSVKGAKVVTDRNTGRSKGYGFVKFGDEGEQQRAMTEMNGVLCSTRPMRIGAAANKTPMATPTQKASFQNIQGNQGDSDPNNTTSDQTQLGGGSYYGYSQGGYEAYGGYAPPQDPSMYYGGSGYANYQQPQQVFFHHSLVYSLCSVKDYVKIT